MKKIELNLKNIKTEEEFHGEVKKTFGFPDYYGENLDAIWDLLSAVSEDMEIDIYGGEEVEENLGEYGYDILELFNDLLEENEHLYIRIE